MKAQPRFHGALSNDVASVLRQFGPTPEEVARRRQTLCEVRNALKELCGNEFYVENCSMSNYAVDLHCAPVELVIVNKDSHPTSGSPLLPDIYNPSLVAQALVYAGFEGGFISYPVDTQSTAPRGTQPPTLREFTTPWPTYQHVPKGGLLYPPQLHVVTPLQFTLTLPSPTILPMYHFLTAVGNALPNILREFISIVYLWIRSLQMTEFTPTCLALIAVRFVQETHNLDFFRDMKQKLKGQMPGCWVPYEYKLEHSDGQSWRTRPVWIDTSFEIDKTIRGSLEPLLLNFFSFWRGAPRIAQDYALSVRQIKYLRRQHVVKQLTEPLIFDEGLLVPDDLSSEPYSWRFNRLVVQDPFLTTHNHAEGVSDETLRYLAYNCGLASQSIRRANPFTAILGNNLAAPPRMNMMLHRLSHTVSELPEVPQAILDRRVQTVRHVQDTIYRNYGKHYKVELFGSTQYGASSPFSDLDLVIIDPERIDGFSPDVDINNLPAIYNVRKLAATLRKAGLVNIQSVPSASVPIVKFRDPGTNMECDINVNDQLGLFNTRMIKSYCDFSPLLRPMIKYIKRWAKPLGLNYPRKFGAPATFSSYALTLMTIGFLQTRGILPNLQANLPELDNNATDGVFWIRSRGGKLKCDARYGSAEGWKPREMMDLGESLEEWFRYWGNAHQYKTHMMSVRKGGLLPRPSQEDGGIDEGPETTSVVSEEQRDEGDDIEEQHLDEDQVQIWARHQLVVVDPFIRTKNVTGSISFQSVERFRLDCQRVVKMLEWGLRLDDVLCELPPVNGQAQRPAKKPHPSSSRPKDTSKAKGQQRNQPLPKSVNSSEGGGSRKGTNVSAGKGKGKETLMQSPLTHPPIGERAALLFHLMDQIMSKP